VTLVREMVEAGKPVLAICHAPWVLIEAGVVRGRRVTSYPSLRTDLVNAGAEWVDEELVSSDGVFTSRNPGDLPVFCEALLGAVRGTG
jgi:protease I